MRRKPLDSDTLWQLERVGSVSLSPDGSAAVCAVTAYSMDENKGRTSLWLLPTGASQPRRLTTAGEKDGQPSWSPDGTQIAFVNEVAPLRNLYVMDADGSDVHQVGEDGLYFVPAWQAHVG